MEVKCVFPSSLPIPKGHYSPAVVHSGVVYVSGQLPVHSDGSIERGDIEEQLKLCMNNLRLILEETGSDLQHILKVNIYLSDISLWKRVNAAYAAIMGDHKPARAIIPCPELHFACGLEVDCIAAVKI